jgi:hypothetical protein
MRSAWSGVDMFLRRSLRGTRLRRFIRPRAAPTPCCASVHGAIPRTARRAEPPRARAIESKRQAKEKHMSNHDTPQVEPTEERLQTNGVTASECDVAQSEEGELDFKISVRKVQVKVQARGVLAE